MAERSERSPRHHSSDESTPDRASDSDTDSDVGPLPPPLGEANAGDDVGASKRRTSAAADSAADVVNVAPTAIVPAAEPVPKKPAPSLGRSGGVYLAPHRAARLNLESADKASREYQRAAWEALRKSLNGLINKVNTTNMAFIVPELFHENLVRGRGLLCRAIMKAQMASPGFSHVYAALVAVVNTKLPEIGELLLHRVIIQFRRAYKRNNKVVAVALAKFVAHLVNQQVAHELLALQMLTLLLENPTDDSVEVAIGFVKECGQMLTELTPNGMHAVFERFRGILHEGEIDKRVQYSIEALFAVRKSRFADFPAVLSDLDLVDRADQITHELSLDDDSLDAHEMLDVWKLDPEFESNDAMWAKVREEILGGGEGGEGGADGGDHEALLGDDVEREHGGQEGEGGEVMRGDDGDDATAAAAAARPPGAPMDIADMSETDLINLRRTMYLTIMSSLDFEECAHKLMKLNLPKGTEPELANMLIECCSQERTYIRMYGLLAQRFCLISQGYQEAFETAFGQQYSTIHRLETNKLRNVAKFFAHLLHTDAMPWTVFEYIHLNEDETTSSSRIFIKILCQELSEYLGLLKLRERFGDAYMAPIFAGLFPRDSARNTRFSINFFTSIGLGALTDDMRAHLKAAPKLAAEAAAKAEAAAAAAAAAAAVAAAAQKKAAPAAGRTSGGGGKTSERRGRSRSFDSGSYSYSSYTGSSRSRSSYSSYTGSSRSSRSSSRSSRSSSRGSRGGRKDTRPASSSAAAGAGGRRNSSSAAGAAAGANSGARSGGGSSGARDYSARAPSAAAAAAPTRSRPAAADADTRPSTRPAAAVDNNRSRVDSDDRRDDRRRAEGRDDDDDQRKEAPGSRGDRRGEGRDRDDDDRDAAHAHSSRRPESDAKGSLPPSKTMRSGDGSTAAAVSGGGRGGAAVSGGGGGSRGDASRSAAPPATAASAGAAAVGKRKRSPSRSPSRSTSASRSPARGRIGGSGSGANGAARGPAAQQKPPARGRRSPSPRSRSSRSSRSRSGSSRSSRSSRSSSGSGESRVRGAAPSASRPSAAGTETRSSSDHDNRTASAAAATIGAQQQRTGDQPRLPQQQQRRSSEIEAHKPHSSSSLRPVVSRAMSPSPPRRDAPSGATVPSSSSSSSSSRPADTRSAAAASQQCSGGGADAGRASARHDTSHPRDRRAASPSASRSRSRSSGSRSSRSRSSGASSRSSSRSSRSTSSSSAQSRQGSRTGAGARRANDAASKPQHTEALQEAERGADSSRIDADAVDDLMKEERLRRLVAARVKPAAASRIADAPADRNSSSSSAGAGVRQRARSPSRSPRRGDATTSTSEAGARRGGPSNFNLGDGGGPSEPYRGGGGGSRIPRVGDLRDTVLSGRGGSGGGRDSYRVPYRPTLGDRDRDRDFYRGPQQGDRGDRRGGDARDRNNNWGGRDNSYYRSGGGDNGGGRGYTGGGGGGGYSGNARGREWGRDADRDRSRSRERSSGADAAYQRRRDDSRSPPPARAVARRSHSRSRSRSSSSHSRSRSRSAGRK